MFKEISKGEFVSIQYRGMTFAVQVDQIEKRWFTVKSPAWPVFLDLQFSRRTGKAIGEMLYVKKIRETADR